MTQGANCGPIVGLPVHKVAQVGVFPKRLNGKRGEGERERRCQERKERPEKFCEIDSSLLTRQHRSDFCATGLKFTSLLSDPLAGPIAPSHGSLEVVSSETAASAEAGGGTGLKSGGNTRQGKDILCAV